MPKKSKFVKKNTFFAINLWRYRFIKTLNAKVIDNIKKNFFHHTARKVRTVRPAGEKQPTHFTLLVEKISICTTGVSKESLRSHIIVARAEGSGDNYMRSETFFTFTP